MSLCCSKLCNKGNNKNTEKGQNIYFKWCDKGRNVIFSDIDNEINLSEVDESRCNNLVKLEILDECL